MGTDRRRYVLLRVASWLPMLLVGTSVTFALVRLSPIDPMEAILGPAVPMPEVRAGLRRELGLDSPLWVRYATYLYETFTLQLGQSWVLAPETPVTTLVLERGPVTATLWVATGLACAAGLAVSAWAGLDDGTGGTTRGAGDRVASALATTLRVIPTFVLAVGVLGVLAVVEPPSPEGWWTFLGDPATVVTGPDASLAVALAAVGKTTMAAVALGSSVVGIAMGRGRSVVREAADRDHVLAARSLGLPASRLRRKHVFRNAAASFVTALPTLAALLVGGTILVEEAAGIPGLGRLFFQAAAQGDLPLAGGLLNLAVFLFVGTHVLRDLLRIALDPRVGTDGGTGDPLVQ